MMTKELFEETKQYGAIMDAVMANQERSIRSSLTSPVRLRLRKIAKQVTGYMPILTSGCCGSRRTLANQLMPLAKEYFAFSAKMSPGYKEEEEIVESIKAKRGRPKKNETKDIQEVE